MFSEEFRTILSLILIVIGIDLMANQFIANLKMRGFKKKNKSQGRWNTSEQQHSDDSPSSDAIHRLQ